MINLPQTKNKNDPAWVRDKTICNAASTGMINRNNDNLGYVVSFFDFQDEECFSSFMI